jgi:hypothetical protein
VEREIGLQTISGLLHDESFRSVFLIVVGFLLAQLNSYFAGRRERIKAISCALSDLLEIRYQFVGLQVLVDEIGDLAGNTLEHEKSKMTVAFDSMFPKWEELHARFDQSVTTLAALNPLLAFQLRSKDFIRPHLRYLHSLMGQDPQAAALFGPILKTNLLSKVEPVLNESIYALAIRKGLICWYKTRRFLKRNEPMRHEFREMLNSLKTAVERQKNAKAAAKAEETAMS